MAKHVRPSPLPTSPPPPDELPAYSWRNRSPDARLVYIRDVKAANEELSKLRPGVFGFDLEWKPNYLKNQSNPVALLQLANAGTILLIQISAMPAVPSQLWAFFKNPHIVKTGVAIQHDCKKLFADCGVDVRSCVDLSPLARSVDNARWKGSFKNAVGLSRLCRTYEGCNLSKKSQRSNWEADLSPLQLEYAANDGHVAFSLYNRLTDMIPWVIPRPRPEYYTFDMIDGHLRDSFTGLPWAPRNPNYDPGILDVRSREDLLLAAGGNGVDPRNDAETTGRTSRALNPGAPVFVPMFACVQVIQEMQMHVHTGMYGAGRPY